MTVLEKLQPDLCDGSHLGHHNSSTYNEALLPAAIKVYFMTLLTAKETNCGTWAKLGFESPKIWSSYTLAGQFVDSELFLHKLI